MKLSIVATLYQSAAYIEEFCKRAGAAARQLVGEDYEIILVNDGSPDNSLEIAVNLTEQDAHLTVIDLSRNFGHHKAMMTGLSHTAGDLVFLIDCDLEEDPIMLWEFYRIMTNSDVDVVYGIQRKRRGRYLERALGSIFYSLFNVLSGYKFPVNPLTARLMSRRYVDALTKHLDREVYMAGLWEVTGFKQIPVTVDKQSNGTTTYNLSRKIALFVNSITSFSNKPLIFVFYLGSLICLMSITAGLWLIFRKVLFGGLLFGWASIMVSIWFLSGVTIFCIGIMGIYISKVFMEVKNRPYTVIRSIYGFDKED